MTLLQPKTGYRYNSDSLFLYYFIKKQSNLKGEVLDVGCGCGVVGLLLKRDFPKINLTALDIQPLNCEITAHNAKKNNLDIKTICADFIDFKSEQKFDFVVSNPPFYEMGSSSSDLHKNISRSAHNLEFHNFCKSANSLIKPKGVLYFCYDPRFLDMILQVLGEYKFKLTKLKFIYPKKSKIAKLALFEAKKSSKSLCEILPDLVVMKKRKFSKKAKKIFKIANTKSIDYERI